MSESRSDQRSSSSRIKIAVAAWARCGRCGGDVPFGAGEKQARCPFCDAPLRAPSPARRGLAIAVRIGVALILLSALGVWGWIAWRWLR